MKMMIEGMMCMHCAKRVKDALEKTGCKAEINLEEKCAVITEATADTATLTAAVEKAGYKVTGVVEA